MDDVKTKKMKIDKKYRLRNVAGENIIVLQGKVGADLTRIISMNESACLLYNRLYDSEFSVSDAAGVLRDTYGISMEQAEKDAASWVASLKDCHVITD